MDPRSTKLRFVVLFHQMPDGSDRLDHWDLMLEREDALDTWALQTEPTPAAINKGIMCDRLPAHRKQYLDYEGPISNNRGKVSQWDTGIFLSYEHPSDGLTFRLEGSKLAGVYQLASIKNDVAEDQWLLTVAEWRFARQLPLH